MIPAHAKTVHRSTTSTGTILYTVPSGRTLYLTAAWASLAGGTAGSNGVFASSEDNGILTAIVLVVAVASSPGNALSVCGTPLVRAGPGTVIMSASTSSGGLYSAGFAGYLA